MVHEKPLTLVLSFPLHQVPGLFSSGAGAGLVHESPLTLVLSFPLHQVRAVFPLRAVEGEASGRRRLGARKPRIAHATRGFPYPFYPILP